MALYNYQALSQEGKKTKGQIDAPSSTDARLLLTQRGMFPISIQPGEGQRSFWSSLFARKVSIRDKILFTKQLAVLLKASVPLLQALELLIEQFEGRLKTMLIDIKDSVKEGNSLAECLARYPRVFDNTYVQLVRAGEATGKLDVILDRLTEFLERKQEINKKIKTATRGPMIQIIMVIAVLAILLVAVVPKIASVFKSNNTELPWETQFVMNISDFIIGNYIFILVGLVGAFIGYKFWARTASGGRIIDTIKLYIPIIGYFTRMGAIVQFSTTLGMLLESGVNLAEALDIVVNIINNKILAHSLAEARDKIVKEGKITQYLKQTGMFPPIAIYLIKTGEESGKLDQMLLTVGNNYENDLSEYAEGLSAKIEPIMLVVMAGIVLFIVVAMVKPMMGLAGAMAGDE